MTVASAIAESARSAILRQAARAANSRTVCLNALRIVQAAHGWVSDDQLREVAALLQMDPAEADGIASFYNLIFRRPVGHHVLQLCDSVSCWMLGCDRLHNRLRRRHGLKFGQTGADGRITLLPTACLGACDGAPALLLDDRLHRAVTPEGIDALVERCR